MINTFLLALALLAGSTHAAPSPVRLALNWKPEPEFGGFYAAQGDIFNKEGLKVEIIPGGAGQPVPQMIAAGKVEFGIANADEVIIARARGADLVAVFAVYQTSPQGIMTHEARGFKTLDEVFKSDGTLAIETGASYASYLFKKYGKEKLKVVPYSGGVANFLHDPKFSQQCFVTSEPIAAKKAGAKVRTFLNADAGYNPYTALVVTSGEYLRKNKATVAQFVKAVEKGWRKYLDHPTETNAVMQKLNPTMDLATFEEIAQVQKPLIETPETKKKGLGTMSLERWQKLAEQLVDLKVIEKAPDVGACFKLTVLLQPLASP